MVFKRRSKINLESVSIDIPGLQVPCTTSIGMSKCIDRRFSPSWTMRHRWFGVRNDSLGGIFSGAVAVYLVYGGKAGISTGDIGFALNQVLAFSMGLLFLTKLVSILCLSSRFVMLLRRSYNMFEVQANKYECRTFG